MHDQLEPILKKDSVQCFLQFKNCAGKGISWDLTITSQTLTWMVAYNALRCAHVELEGEVPELCGMHANPNCINCYGYFPLHEAAERFSVDMIELLFCHGASANVRTVGNEVKTYSRSMLKLRILARIRACSVEFQLILILYGN
jgi:hypothetical protein